LDLVGGRDSSFVAGSSCAFWLGLSSVGRGRWWSVEDFSDSLGRFGADGGLSPGVKDQHESSAVAARERLREVQQAQASALSAYVSSSAKVDRAREELERHEEAVRCALGLLASTTSLGVAVELTGVSVGVARDAGCAPSGYRGGCGQHGHVGRR
jgi:hypothetical protein